VLSEEGADVTCKSAACVQRGSKRGVRVQSPTTRLCVVSSSGWQ